VKVIRQRLKRTVRQYQRYRISIILGATLSLTFAAAVLLLIAFLIDSVSVVRANKEELFDRDLRDAVSRLDSDERATLQNNVDLLASRERELGPVVLPRQYYSAPQIGPNASPKHPPRNCFVNLINAASRTPTEDKLCAYFAESKNFGSFVFVVAEFSDDFAVPLKYGDRSFSADYMELSLETTNASTTWKIAPQIAPAFGRQKFLTTAFRERQNGRLELDRRVEGWATFTPQALWHNRWTFYLRIDYREFMSKMAGEGVWPPDPRKVKLILKRSDRSQNSAEIISYSSTGTVDFSVSDLIQPLLKNHADVKVMKGEASQPIASYFADDTSTQDENKFIYLSGYDINIRKAPILKKAVFPDTTVSLQVSHPGIVIEKRVWAMFLSALLLVILTAQSCRAAYRLIIRPILTWTSLSQQMTAHGERAFSLPFSDRADEIGRLAKSFNALLSESYRRVQREQAENEYRAEVLSLREQNFQVIGHEIRSPLQALSVLIKPEDEGRRYVDRILRALPSLERVHTIEDSITNREAQLKTIDLVAFVAEIIENAPLIGIDLFDFDAQIPAAICKVDPEALEDVLENLIRNANRHRDPETPINITILRDNERVTLQVTNQGEPIPGENIARIFDFGFSTTDGEPGRVAGVGLSISRHNILKMRGQLTAENLSPSRVRFTITLPLMAS
jgi:signal transduction histidine kinase